MSNIQDLQNKKTCANRSVHLDFHTSPDIKGIGSRFSKENFQKALKTANLESITVMVQKEVADRMQVGPGTKDYGALSLAVQYYAKPETPLMIVADFNSDEFNINEWAYNSTEISTGAGVVAQNGVLRFEGAGQNSAIAAQFKYSNFELQYEIFDMKNTLSVSDDDSILSYSLGIGMIVLKSITSHSPLISFKK